MSSPESSSAKPLQDPPAAPARPTLPQALLALAVVIVAIAGYIMLSTALGLREAYIGFVFVFYWMSLDQGKPERLPAIVVGACFGLSAAWLLQYALHSAQPAVLLPTFLAAVALSIVCLILGKLPLVFNIPAMLMLTVFTIPHIQQAADFPQLFIALAFATAYFGLLVGGLTKLAARLKPAAG